MLRGACSLKDDRTEGEWRRLILDFRTDSAILNFVNGTDLGRYCHAGVITPDHAIRTKAWPLLVHAPAPGKEAEFKLSARAAVNEFIEHYRAYFDRHNARVGGNKRMLDPLPRVVLVPGLGLFGLGRSKKEAKIAADLAVSAVSVITDAEAVGRFESISEADLFDMEYWSLEQFKARQRKGTAPRRSDRRHHRRRWHYRRNNRKSVCSRRCGARAARSEMPPQCTM